MTISGRTEDAGTMIQPISLTETRAQGDFPQRACRQMFFALFINNEKEETITNSREMGNNLRCVHRVEYYTAVE